MQGITEGIRGLRNENEEYEELKDSTENYEEILDSVSYKIYIFYLLNTASKMNSAKISILRFLNKFEAIEEVYSQYTCSNYPSLEI